MANNNINLSAMCLILSLRTETAADILLSSLKICLQGLKYDKLHGQIADNMSMACEIILSEYHSNVAGDPAAAGVPTVYTSLHALSDALRRAVTVVQVGAATVLGRVLFHAPLDSQSKLVNLLLSELLVCFSSSVSRARSSQGSVGDEAVVAACVSALCNAAKALSADMLTSHVIPVLQACAMGLSRPAHGHSPVQARSGGASRASGGGPRDAPQPTPGQCARCATGVPGPVMAAHAQALHSTLACLEVWLVQVPLPGEAEGASAADQATAQKAVQALGAPLRTCLSVAYAAARLALRPGDRTGALYAARALELWLTAHGFHTPPPNKAHKAHAVQARGAISSAMTGGMLQRGGGVAWTAGAPSAEAPQVQAGPPQEEQLQEGPMQDEPAQSSTRSNSAHSATASHLPHLDFGQLQVHVEGPPVSSEGPPAGSNSTSQYAAPGQPHEPSLPTSYTPDVAPSRFSGSASTASGGPSELGGAAAARGTAPQGALYLPRPLDVKKDSPHSRTVQQLVGGCRLKVPPWVPTGSLRRLPWEIVSVLTHVPSEWAQLRAWGDGVLPQFLGVLAAAVASVALHCPPRDCPASSELHAALEWIQPLVHELKANVHCVLPSTATSVRVVLASLAQGSHRGVGRAAARLQLVMPQR